MTRNVTQTIGGNLSLLLEDWKLLASPSVPHFLYWENSQYLISLCHSNASMALWSLILSFSSPFFLKSSQWKVGINLSSSGLLLPHSAVFEGEGIVTLPSFCMDKSGMRFHGLIKGSLRSCLLVVMTTSRPAILFVRFDFLYIHYFVLIHGLGLHFNGHSWTFNRCFCCSS